MNLTSSSGIDGAISKSSGVGSHGNDVSFLNSCCIIFRSESATSRNMI